MANQKTFQITNNQTGLLTIYGVVLQQATGLCFNKTTGLFSAVPVPTPADYCIAATEQAVLKGIYYISDSQSIWPDGTYIAAWYNRVGGAPDPSADTFIGATEMNVINDQEISPIAPAPASAGGNYTINDIATAVRIDVKDSSKGKYLDSTVLKIINDGIDILHSILCNFDPGMFRVPVTLNLTKAAGNGPYTLDADFNMKRFEWIMNADGTPLVKSSRNDVALPLTVEQPQKFWLEGLHPTKVYFNSIPDKNYTFTAFYIKSIPRATQFNQAYPFADNTFSAIVSYCSYALLNLDEYITQTEEQRTTLLVRYLSDDLLSRSEDIQLVVYAGYSDGPSDRIYPTTGNPLNL